MSVLITVAIIAIVAGVVWVLFKVLEAIGSAWSH